TPLQRANRRSELQDIIAYRLRATVVGSGSKGVMTAMPDPRTLHDLKNSRWADPPYRGRTVRDEIRANLLKRLESDEPLFPGIVGYEDTIIPQIVNALLARHHFILLGLRGQAKSRILRELTSLLDEKLPIVAGSEVNDDPFAPISKYARDVLA